MLEITQFEENVIKEKFKTYKGEDLFCDYMLHLEFKFTGKSSLIGSLETREMFEEDFKMATSDEMIKAFIKINK
jgi:hypothetical protein